MYMYILFQLFPKYILREARLEIGRGFKTEGRNFNNLCCVDGTDLPDLLIKVKEQNEKNGTKIKY